MLAVIDKGVANKVQINKLKHKATDSKIELLGNNNSVYVESNCEFKNLRIVIKGDNSHFTIKRGCRFWGGSISISDQTELYIGERTNIGLRCEFILESANVRIGNDCMSAAGLTIRTSDTHGVYDLDSGLLVNQPQDIVVGDYVWFGKDVTIMKGSEVGSCCVIALGAIVTKKTGDFELWGGIPASKLKDNIIWSKSARLKSVEDDKYASLYISKYKNADGALSNDGTKKPGRGTKTTATKKKSENDASV
ncbi:MAG TPA: hypothetical protein DD666_09535 [Advenella kashmirensis]|uniref:Acyltransferase n=1 Tax=Advenella kashmirensis TaxID=310575 RepID=A0A356LF47_9BURK|nr:hypothetical protein [Advenella kashmirensis]